MTILEKLKNDRILIAELSSDKSKLIITEQCDEYFQSRLSKKELQRYYTIKQV